MCKLNYLKKLSFINLQSNQLTAIQPEAFKELKFLKRLDLSFNHFQKLHSDYFSGLKNLEVLNLKSNNLSIINNDPFKYLSGLGQLDLSNPIIN